MGKRLVTLGCDDCKHQIDGRFRMAGLPCPCECGGQLKAFVSPTPDAPGAWLTGGDVRRVMNALGVRGPDRSRWGHRNHYAPGERDAESMRRLVDAGLMRRDARDGMAHVYRAMPLAGELLGFGPTLMRRAFGGGS